MKTSEHFQRINRILEILLLLFGFLAVLTYMQNRDLKELEAEAKEAKSREAQAIKLLNTCMNGKYLILLNDKGTPDSAMFCDKAIEVKL